MSHYTTQLRYIIEDYTQGFTGSLSNRIQAAAPLIFDFPYPIWKEDYRLTLETKILRHYFNKEIGLETEGLWKFYLETRMNEIMPYYNKLYETVEKQYNWLWDTDLNEDFSGEGTSHNENDLNGNVHSTENMDETKDTTGHTNAHDSDLVNRNGTENETYGRDDTTTALKDTSTKTAGNETTDASGSLNIDDTRNITENSHGVEKKTGTESNVAKEVYAGTSDEHKTLSETSNTVNTDYPQAGMGDEDYASSGQVVDHNSDSDSHLTSNSTKDNTSTTTFDTTVTKDDDKTTRDTYGRDQTSKDDKTVTVDNTVTGTENENNRYTMDTTKDNRWSDTENANRQNDTWETGNSVGNRTTVGDVTTNNNQTADGHTSQTHNRLRQGASGNRSLTSMLMEYRNSLINIDMLIIGELRDLFMTIY